MKENNNLPILLPAGDLTIQFPDKNPHLTDKEAAKSRALIKEHGVYKNDGQSYIGKKALPHLFGTDQKAVNRFMAGLDGEDKIERGRHKYASVPAVNKELSRRIDDPRDSLVRERARDSEGCINAFRDAPELEKRREIEESKIRRDVRRLKQKKMKVENIKECQLTGQLLEPDAAAHHIERQADQPRKARDLNNVIVVNPGPHDEVHRAGAESPEELASFCQEKGWSPPRECKNDA